MSTHQPGKRALCAKYFIFYTNDENRHFVPPYIFSVSPSIDVLKKFQHFPVQKYDTTKTLVLEKVTFCTD